jgi:stage V sporulation protein S
MDILKVSTKSSPNAVAGAIAGILREQHAVCVQVIGAGALNQAIKAIAIARAFVSDDGIDPVCIPRFHDVDIGGESRTAIRLHVEHRTYDSAADPVATAQSGEPAQAAP